MNVCSAFSEMLSTADYSNAYALYRMLVTRCKKMHPSATAKTWSIAALPPANTRFFCAGTAWLIRS